MRRRNNRIAPVSNDPPRVWNLAEAEALAASGMGPTAISRVYGIPKDTLQYRLEMQVQVPRGWGPKKPAAEKPVKKVAPKPVAAASPKPAIPSLRDRPPMAAGSDAWAILTHGTLLDGVPFEQNGSRRD